MPLSVGFHPLIQKIERHIPLSSEEKQAIVALPFAIREVGRGQDVVRDRDRPSQCAIIIHGMACRYKTLERGDRRIFSFHIRGDMPDLDGLHLEVMDHSVAVMEASTIALLPHEYLRRLLDDFPRVANALWRDSLADAAIYREWLVNIGGRNAYSRIAHLICETFVRLRAMGLAPQGAFRLPITQEELGEAVALSTVHVNRILQQLRRDKLIRWQNRSITISNWEDLQEAAGFDDLYLHQPARGAAGTGLRLS